MGNFSKNKLKKLVTVLLIVVGIFVALNYFLPTIKSKFMKEKTEQVVDDNQDKKEPEGEEVIPVKVMDVIKHDFIDVLDALGNIKGGLEFKLTFQIPGTIESVNFRPGDKYEKGALLMSLNQDDIILRMRRAEATMKKAQISVDLMDQKLLDHEKLFSLGAISKSTLDKVKLELESSEYELESASLEVKANEAVLDKSNLYAISDGMIGELNVEEGEVITSNTLIGTHLLIEYVKAEFGVIERDLAKLEEGQSADVIVDAYANQTFKGVVDSIAPVVGGVSRTATVTVKIDNKEGLLQPGMFAQIKINLYQKRDAIIVPTEAVLKTQEGDFAFVLNEEESTVSKVALKVGYARTDFSQIDEGLEEGQTVAITSLKRLKDAGKVEVIEKQTLEYE